jgi:aminoglycoside 6-adenylyltransferase
VIGLPDEGEVLARLAGWTAADPSVRAVILTSSRTTPDGRADLLSDYDVILAVRDPAAFLEDDAWQSRQGPPAARWGDEAELLGLGTSFRGVVYRDGIKIDYTIWPEAMLERVSAQEALPEGLDVGYRVLLDKDGRASNWLPPTYQAHVLARPTEAEYRAVVEEFWWSATYVAKALWRGEIVFAKFTLDQDVRIGALRRVLEWRIELDHDWSLRPGAYGRGLERLLPAGLWPELAATYAGAGSSENWDALFATAALFRRVAAEVGAALGYAYPVDVDEIVTAHLQAVRELPVKGVR